MKRCWRLPAEERPRFTELVAVLDKILQSATGYMELSMTLNKSPVVTKEMEKEEEEEEDWSGYEITRPEFVTEHSKFSYANQTSAVIKVLCFHVKSMIALCVVYSFPFQQKRLELTLCQALLQVYVLLMTLD